MSGITVIPALAHDGCYDWPLREGYGGRIAYDADTIYITMPGLPGELSKMSVRVDGIDTPEIRGKCDEEKAAAIVARDYVISLLDGSETLLVCDPQWGKYAGRVLGSVIIGGEDLTELLVAGGHGRRYEGGARDGWCEE